MAAQRKYPEELRELRDRQRSVESTTKTSRARHVLVPEPVWERLQAEPPRSERPRVSQPSWRAPAIGEYRRVFEKGSNAVGIIDSVPHDLRPHHGIARDRCGR
jgi:hypothetical protein